MKKQEEQEITDEFLKSLGFEKYKSKHYNSRGYHSEGLKFYGISLMRRKGQLQMYLGGSGGKKFSLVIESKKHLVSLLKELTRTRHLEVY